MSAAQHTPGPWELGDFPEWPDYNTAIHAPSKWLNLAQVVTVNSGEQDEEGKANARLIAAAPDLLEALEGCVNGLWATNKEVVEKARAAIAKAKGDPS